MYWDPQPLHSSKSIEVTGKHTGGKIYRKSIQQEETIEQKKCTKHLRKILRNGQNK